jgi:hypothetical protein
MIAQILTTDEIRNCDGRNYNPTIWDMNIDRMTTNYTDVIFYKVAKGNGYDYDRYFVEYTLPEGLRLFGNFGYSGSITSGGFYRLDKQQISSDGRTIHDAIQLINDGKKDEGLALVKDIDGSKVVELSYGKMYDPDGNEVMIGTSKEARAWMTERSVKYGVAYTKG